MKDRIQNAFDNIQADDVLLAKTAAYLQKKRVRYEKKHNHIHTLRLISAMATMLVLVIGVFGYHTFLSKAAAYVSIDVNPSVELTLNRTDKVIAAIAYNADGEILLQQVEVTGKKYDEAVTMLLAEMKLQGYISNNVLVTMTVQTSNGTKERNLCNALRQSVDSQINIAYSSANVEIFPVTQEVREIANDCHMSAAKYLAIQELIEVDETATLEAYSDSTIHQIRQRTRECRKDHKNSFKNENHSTRSEEGTGQNQNSNHSQNNSSNQSGSHGHRGKQNGR